MDVAIEPLEGKVWNSRRFALDLQLLLYRWFQDYADPHDQYFLVEDGYLLASTASRPSADVILIDATNGVIVGRAGGCVKHFVTKCRRPVRRPAGRD